MPVPVHVPFVLSPSASRITRAHNNNFTGCALISVLEPGLSSDVHHASPYTPHPSRRHHAPESVRYVRTGHQQSSGHWSRTRSPCHFVQSYRLYHSAPVSCHRQPAQNRACPSDADSQPESAGLIGVLVVRSYYVCVPTKQCGGHLLLSPHAS
jgi:hypothetical protein